jgi:hypothetical protein
MIIVIIVKGVEGGCVMDILFIGIMIALVAASWFFVKLVERV